MRRSGVDHSRLAHTAHGAPRALSALAQAVADAMDETCARIAEARPLRVDDARRQLADVVRWLDTDCPPNAGGCRTESAPVVAREYVDMFRSALLARLAEIEEVDGTTLVRLLRSIEELSLTWKRTDRGRFISRLTGTDSADAVVAVAHDIRSPLTSILILVDSLRRGQHAPADPTRDRQLGIIYGAAQGLSTLASDLIDAARGERLAIGPPTAFSVTEAMSAVLQILEPVSEERSIPLRLHTPTVDGRIGHPGALQRVLLNLASNALRCTESGFVAISCTELTATTVEFAVTDTGPGISADSLQRLFEGFTSERLSLRFSRTGLGLAIVRTLLEAMGAVLEVETAPGRGARFFFQLELPHAR